MYRAESGIDEVPCPVRARAVDEPNAVALEGPDGLLTYAELDDRVEAAEVRLAASGLAPGARVAILSENNAAYVIALLALLRGGYVACPMNVRRPTEQLRSMIREIDCAAIEGTNLRLDGVSALSLGELTRPPSDASGELQPRPGLEGRSSKTAGVPAAPCRLDSSPEPTLGPLPRLRLDQPATIVFTSGSSGHPRAALHTFGNHWFSALGANENMPIGVGDRWLLSLPLYHVGGLGIVFRCVVAGAAICLPDPSEPLASNVGPLGITHLSLVPTQLRRLLDDPSEPPVAQLRSVLLGGAPAPRDLVDRALRRSLPLHSSYGLTEMASQVTTTPPGAGAEILRTAGRPLPYRQLSIASNGEIRVRGKTLFAGYVTDAGPHLPLDEDGWFRTGDLGRLNGEGLLHVRGRLDNLFISGGENIQPEEIELAILALPDVEDAVVVPIPDSEFGARPVAVIRTLGGPPDCTAIRAHLRRRLPGYMIPMAILEAPGEIPAGSMKPERVRVREFVLGRLGSESTPPPPPTRPAATRAPARRR